MAELERIAEGVWGARTRVGLGAGAWLPLRMTVLRDGEGLTLVSPIAIDDALAEQLAALGSVTRILAPNRLHHLHVAAAAERYPEAEVLAAPGLAAKRPDLRLDRELGTGPVSDELEALLIEGAPKLSEVVLLHRPSRTLVVTDLVFNIREASGTSRIVLAWVSRALGRAEQSRLFRWITKDRAAAGKSVEQVLRLPFARVVPAHGEVIEHNAVAELSAATWWMRGEPRRPEVTH